MNKTLLFIWFGLFLYTCKSSEKIEKLPKAISQEINNFSASSTCSDASVKQMKFNDQIVFLFEDGTCAMDKESMVMDRNGKLLGYLGGFEGNTMILGKDFSEAAFQKLIWKKNQSDSNQ